MADRDWLGYLRQIPPPATVLKVFQPVDSSRQATGLATIFGVFIVTHSTPENDELLLSWLQRVCPPEPSAPESRLEWLVETVFSAPDIPATLNTDSLDLEKIRAIAEDFATKAAFAGRNFLEISYSADGRMISIRDPREEVDRG